MNSTARTTFAIAVALALAATATTAGAAERTRAAAQPVQPTSGPAAQATRVDERPDTARLAEPQPGDYEAYVDEEDCG